MDHNAIAQEIVNRLMDASEADRNDADTLHEMIVDVLMGSE